MRVHLLILALSGAAGCGPGTEEPVPMPVLPRPGRYQATLTGYTARDCPDALGAPVGTLDASAQFGYLFEGRVEVSGGRLWPFGPVRLRPGDPRRESERLAWVGTAEARAEQQGCDLQAGVRARYFPIDAEHGSLHLRTRYAAADGRCVLPLPCEDEALWSLAYFP